MAGSQLEFSGRLTERVRIERRMPDLDGAGGSSDHWMRVGTAWAQVEPMSRFALSQVLADARQTARLWRVTMRSEWQVMLDMRLAWRGGVLMVVGVEPDPGRPDRVIVLAEELGP